MSDSDQTTGLTTDIIDSVAIIRFDRPATRNSLSQDILEKLERSLDRLQNTNRLNALIFTGTDGVFASGANIHELRNLSSESAEAFSKRGQQLFQKIAAMKETTIAAINGYCMGGALDLALACTVRIASKDAIFAHPGARLGIITGWGGTQRLPRLIGQSKTLELFLTARRFKSTEALEMGLITELFDPVLERALEMARKARA